jgi:TetR/AcrR family fatty acid metabolism transcriptional regulator
MKNKKPKYNQIMEAAIKVIAENGFHGAQVSKVAKEAGVAEGTIYLYFKNKEDILISIFTEKMGQYVQEVIKETSKKQNAKEKLYTLIEMHFKQFMNNHHLAVVTQLELRQSNYDLRLKINKNILKPHVDVIDKIIVEGIEEGVFKSNINIRLMRQMIFGTLDDIVTNWVMNNHKYDLLEQVEEVYELLTNGLYVQSQ